MAESADLPAPLFSSSYPHGRLTLASGGDPPLLFVLSKPSGSLFRINPENGQESLRLIRIPQPEDLAVGAGGQRVLVSLDASRSLWVLPVSSGPPVKMTVGLNPGQIVRTPTGDLYLVARAVHIIYHLNPVTDRPDGWTAMGDVFPQITPDAKGDLWLPLSRGEQVKDLSPRTLETRKIFDLDSCREPSRVRPLPSGGFVVGCRNALLLEGQNGEELTRSRLRGRLSRGVQDMVLLPGGDRLLVSFRKCKTLNLYHLPDLSIISSFHSSYLPVRLYYFKKWPTIFIVMDDPGNDRTRLFGYSLSTFGTPSLSTQPVKKSPAPSPTKLLPRAVPSTSSPRTHS
ncbi:MAG: YncE family protein [Leptospirillia bacterium]